MNYLFKAVYAKRQNNLKYFVNVGCSFYFKNEFKADPVPVGLNTAEEKHNINITANDKSYTLAGEIVSTQAISSKTRTVETVTVS